MAQKNRKRRASVKNKQRPSPAATGRRPAKRGAGDDLDGVAIGRELRGIANRLELAESCLIVIHRALDCQDVGHDGEISSVLMHVLNCQIFGLIRDLENVAATCDGGPRSDRNEDNVDTHTEDDV